MNDAASPLWLNVVSATVLVLMIAGWRLVLMNSRRGRPAIRSRSRNAVPWMADGAMLAGVFLFAGWVGALTTPDETPKELNLRLVDVAAFGLTWALLAGVSIGWIVSHRSVSAEDFGLPLNIKEAARDTVLGVTACAAMLLPIYVVQALLVWGVGLPSSHPALEELMANPSVESIAASVVMAAVIAPFFEELAFRVLLQGWLERLGGRRAWWPIVASSAAFASAHVGQGWAPIPLFVLALGIGYVYRQTHRFVPILAMHMAFNALSLTVALASAGGNG